MASPTFDQYQIILLGGKQRSPIEGKQANSRLTLQACLSVEGRYAFCFRDVDLDPMTLLYETDLDILKTYLHIPEMNFLGQSF